MRRTFEIDISKIEKYYTIMDDGQIWSGIKYRWLKPQMNSSGYIYYCLTGGLPRSTWIFAHTLVALKYIGSPPDYGYEIDHIDNNKANNYYENLRWVTHSQNIKKGFDDGRKGFWLGKSKPSPDIETRMRMSNAKKKMIKYVLDDEERIFNSIEEAAWQLGTYRKRIYLGIKEGRLFNGGILSEVKEEF